MPIELQIYHSTPMTDRRFGEVHFDDIVAARRLLARELTPTPLVAHPLLSRRVGAEVHVKLENAVPLGSFKLRGGLNFLASLSAEQKARGLDLLLSRVTIVLATLFIILSLAVSYIVKE